MSKLQSLDAHEQPPTAFKVQFKKFQKLAESDYALEPDLIDLTSAERHPNLHPSGTFASSELAAAFSKFLGSHGQGIPEYTDVPTYELKSVPGLFVAPSLLPPSLQQTLISRMVHRDLSNPTHKTNLHLHYEIPYPAEITAEEQSTQSFFSYSPRSPQLFSPKDPSVHKLLSISQVLQKKLRWMTLGGQYDWTAKKYPNEQPPQFPTDIQDLVQGLYPEMKCQAAIVNFYSPGDTLSLHRDVSEYCDNGLVSISFGCDCLFMIGLSVGEQDSAAGEAAPFAIIRLRSGDAVYMSEEARSAWHGVPKVLSNTCPEYLQDWPADGESENFDAWRGWMRNKRINLNIRQM